MDGIIDCGGGFWNIRGAFRLGGVVNIGTHSSLFRLDDGRFGFLDSYAFLPEQMTAIARITGGAENVAFVLNTHPFHTVFSEPMQAAFPTARHYGTARHKRLYPALDWEDEVSEDPTLWSRLAPDLELSRPAGVDFISQNERVHFAGLFAYHPASRVLHVDDTFNYPRFFGLGRKGRLSLHPSLGAALEKRPGAAADFRAWGQEIVARWPAPSWVVTAHNDALPAADAAGGAGLGAAMADALARGEKVLAKHEAQWG